MPDSQEQKPRNEILDTIKVIAEAVVLAVGIQLFTYQPFFIPSGSMLGTLLIGDYLAVSKFTYGYSWASWPVAFMQPLKPYLPQGRLFGSEPQRGDVVVFKLPSDGKTDYIKRLIGLPGDKIQMKSGVLYINGQAVPKKKVEDFTRTDISGRIKHTAQFEETLPNGVKYRVLDEDPNGEVDTTPVYEVPQGHYFMMGDNRDNSQDSRFAHPVGFVPYDHLVGRADRLAISVDEHYSAWEIWNWPKSMRLGRFFSEIK